MQHFSYATLSRLSAPSVLLTWLFRSKVRTLVVNPFVLKNLGSEMRRQADHNGLCSTMYCLDKRTGDVYPHEWYERRREAGHTSSEDWIDEDGVSMWNSSQGGPCMGDADIVADSEEQLAEDQEKFGEHY
eukprot:3886231-Karenia_brevis.AAC.1